MSAVMACRMCLAVDARLYTVANTPLQDVYERITNIPFLNGDERVEKVCYLCRHLLWKNQAFMEKIVKADELLRHALVKGIELAEVSVRLKEMSGVCSSLCMSSPTLTDILPQEKATDLKAETDKDVPAETLVKIEPPDVKEEIEIEVENSDLFLKEEKYISPLETDVTIVRSEDEELTAQPSSATLRENETEDPQTNTYNSILSHALKKPYRCSHCDKVFNQKKTLDKHISIKHKEENPHQCSYCKKIFTQKSVLTRHFLTHVREKPHQCSHCDKTFNRKYDLEQHVLLHTGGKHQCSHCDKAFSRKRTLNKHIITHDGVTPYQCSYCNKGFIHKRELNDHILTHTGKILHQCSYCNKTFNHMSYLNRHILTHTGEKPHRCSKCNKSFSIKSSLLEHVLIHTGVKPQQCSYCDKAFTHKSTLIRHHQQVHSGAKPYECSYCNESFTYKSVLIKHRNTAHPDKTAPSTYKVFQCNTTK